MVCRVVVAGLEIIEAGFVVIDIAAVSQRVPERDCRAGGLRRKKRNSTPLPYIGAVKTQYHSRCYPFIGIISPLICK